MSETLLEKLAFQASQEYKEKTKVDVKGYVRGGRYVKPHSKEIQKKLKSDTAKELGASALVGGSAMTIIGGIGKARFMEPNKNNTTNDFTQLLSKLKPGDVLLTGDADRLTPARAIVALGSGDDYVGHTCVVNRVTKNYVEILDYNRSGYHIARIDREGFKHMPVGLANEKNTNLPKNVTAVRTKDPALQARALNNYRRRVSAFENLRKGLVARGIPEKDSFKLMTYSFSRSPVKWSRQAVNELFTPFFSTGSTVKDKVAIRKAELSLRNLETNMDKYADSIATAIKSGKKNWASMVPKEIVTECSTAATLSGFPVYGPKPVTLAAPADALRRTGEKESPVALVGHFRHKISSKQKLISNVLRVAPSAIRFGTGAAAAGAAYGGYRYLKKKKKKQRAAMKTQ